MEQLFLYNSLLHKNMDSSLANLDLLLKQILSPKRYNHVFRVLETARKIALMLEYSKDKIENISRAVLFHDFAKGMSSEELKCYGISNKIDFSENPAPVYHAIVGAWIAEFFFSEYNHDILEAVKFHTTGHPNLCFNETGIVLFLADYLEPGRRVETKDIWNFLPNHLFDALYAVVKAKLFSLLEKEFFIASDSIQFYNVLHQKKYGTD